MQDLKQQLYDIQTSYWDIWPLTWPWYFIILALLLLLVLIGIICIKIVRRRRVYAAPKKNVIHLLTHNLHVYKQYNNRVSYLFEAQIILKRFVYSTGDVQDINSTKNWVQLLRHTDIKDSLNDNDYYLLSECGYLPKEKINDLLADISIEDFNERLLRWCRHFPLQKTKHPSHLQYTTAGEMKQHV